MKLSSDKKNAETVKQLKKAITQEQTKLYQHIDDYSRKYYDFLCDVLHKCELSGNVMRKSDKIIGKFRVEKNVKFAFLEPYVIKFAPSSPYIPSETIYNVANVIKDYEKIIIN